MKPKSLFTRLLLSNALIILLTLLILGGVFNYLLQHYLSKSREAQFTKVAKTMSNTILLKQSMQNEDTWTLDSIIKQVSQSAATDVVIINAKGQVLASTNSRIADQTLTNTEVISVLSGTPYDKWGGSFLGVPSLTVGYPVKDKGQIIGAIFLDAPLKGFQASLFTFRLLILYAALFSLLMSAIVAYILAKSISRPILEMNKSAKALARGKDLNLVNYHGNDEIASLVAMFNRSVREVQNTRAQQHKLEEQRREFVANVSHEFRAPVTSLQGFLELMQDGIIPEAERPKYFALMLNDTARLNRLVNDLLDMARLQAEQVKLKPEALNPIKLAETLLLKLSPQATEHGVSLVKDFPTSVTFVVADKDRLEQILLNLLDNALRYTPAGGNIVLKIQPDHTSTCFEIQDSGPGIPAADLPHVFERFYKVDKARTPDKGGTGLGLAIVKDLVEAHGGQIEVVSEPGQGAKFTFCIPNA
ncbi:MAG: ATP-binding protein [Peptococcaceae bacterium]|nr:ATP-binding protein [Peptococcaceae bacterium]